MSLFFILHGWIPSGQTLYVPEPIISLGVELLDLTVGAGMSVKWYIYTGNYQYFIGHLSMWNDKYSPALLENQ